jgi:predicted DNA-binding ribbon-helix-helix protein
MKSSIVKRSVVIDGHKTSVSLEDPFWVDLKKIAHTQQTTLSELVTKIDGTREQGNLSSAIRLFVLHHFLSEDKRMEAAKAHLSAVGAERTPASQP